MYEKVEACTSRLNLVRSSVDTDPPTLEARGAVEEAERQVAEGRTKLRVCKAGLENALGRRGRGGGNESGEGVCPTCGQDVRGESKER
jgi:hypothetical protein